MLNKTMSSWLIPFYLLVGSANVSAQTTFADHWEFVGKAVEERGYHIWGTSPIWGDDGKVHLFVARWPKEYKVDPGWRSHSEIAHYVGDKPEEPFVFSDIALKGTGQDSWDKYGIHNPNIQRVGDKYVLLYIANDNFNQPPHPSNQNIGMVVSDSPYGPWRKVNGDRKILSPPTNPDYWNYQALNGVVNPALLYFKSSKGRMGLAIAQSLEGPYVQTPLPVTANGKTIEDGYAFIYNDEICLLTTDNHGIIEKGGGVP